MPFSTTRGHHCGQSISIASTTRLFWPGRFLLAASPRPGESCTGCDEAPLAFV